MSSSSIQEVARVAMTPHPNFELEVEHDISIIAPNNTWSATDSSSHYDPSNLPLCDDESEAMDGFDSVRLDPELNGLPAKQGLYDAENEKDACGVGFVVHIKGKTSHKIVSDARGLLCNMTHRGASELAFDVLCLLKVLICHVAQPICPSSFFLVT